MSVIIFEKNKIDLDTPNVTITASDSVATDSGSSYVDLLRNRRNDSGWGTGGSSDAGGTNLVIETTDAYTISDIILVGMNFASYTFQYWNGSAYTDFSTPISVTGNTTTTKYHTFNEVSFSRSKLTINGTMTANDDKLMRQLIMTKRLGTFTTQPFIKKPRQEKGRKARKMLSGRTNLTRSIGAFSCVLSFPPNKSSGDADLITDMYDSVNGFLVWLCGGSTSDFPYQVPGFRLQDVILMNCINELETEWVGGQFNSGQQVDIQLAESRI